MKARTTNDDDEEKSFDYTFDYVIAGARRIKLSEVAALVGKGLRATQRIAEDSQYTLASRGGELWVDDFPSDPFVIIEIMASSTSGGDKKKRTQIAMACEDAVVSPDIHNGPGINYRQIWARMVSQLIVKSQISLAWDGKTIWIIQDLLAQYISSTTALDLSKYIAQQSDEVNILAFGYGDVEAETPTPIIELNNRGCYAGPIAEGSDNSVSKGFADIVKIGAAPDKKDLWCSLFKKAPCGSIAWDLKSN